jgi:hypothetical protein
MRLAIDYDVPHGQMVGRLSLRLPARAARAVGVRASYAQEMRQPVCTRGIHLAVR